MLMTMRISAAMSKYLKSPKNLRLECSWGIQCRLQVIAMSSSSAVHSDIHLSSPLLRRLRWEDL